VSEEIAEQRVTIRIRALARTVRRVVKIFLALSSRRARGRWLYEQGVKTAGDEGKSDKG
jgi:hypothetical protein